jgi:hypothetical protein
MPPAATPEQIAETARRAFGGYLEMFEHHGWPERGADMMRKVQTRVAETYGSVRNFADAHKASGAAGKL